MPITHKKKKNGGRRKGSGNKKKDLIPTEEDTTPLDFCPDCKDLQNQPVLETRSRVVEDIPEKQEPVVFDEITERKLSTKKSFFKINSVNISLLLKEYEKIFLNLWKQSYSRKLLKNSLLKSHKRVIMRLVMSRNMFPQIKSKSLLSLKSFVTHRNLH